MQSIITRNGETEIIHGNEMISVKAPSIKIGEPLKSIVIDTEKGIYMVNGRDIAETTHRLELEFSCGEWTLCVEETRLYRAEGAIKSNSKE